MVCSEAWGSFETKTKGGNNFFLPSDMSTLYTCDYLTEKNNYVFTIFKRFNLQVEKQSD